MFHGFCAFNATRDAQQTKTASIDVTIGSQIQCTLALGGSLDAFIDMTSLSGGRLLPRGFSTSRTSKQIMAHHGELWLSIIFVFSSLLVGTCNISSIFDPHDLCFSHLRPAFAVFLRHAYFSHTPTSHTRLWPLVSSSSSAVAKFATRACVVATTNSLHLWGETMLRLASHMPTWGLLNFFDRISSLFFHHPVHNVSNLCYFSPCWCGTNALVFWLQNCVAVGFAHGARHCPALSFTMFH